jgi:hypothetical protein
MKKIFESFKEYYINEALDINKLNKVISIESDSSSFFKYKTADKIGGFRHAEHNNWYNLLIPDEFDKKLINKVIVSDSEVVFKIWFDSMLSHMYSFVKINMNKGLVYFKENEESEDLYFSKKGVKIKNMVLLDTYYSELVNNKDLRMGNVILNENPLTGKTKRKAIDYIYNDVIHRIGSDRYKIKWEGRNEYIDAIENARIEINIVNDVEDKGNKDKLIPPSMVWYIEIPFINDKLKNDKIKGTITAHSIDNWEKYDMTFVIY